MEYSVQNSETGEVEYFQCDKWTRFPMYDEETGEPTINDDYKVRYAKRRNFQIPKSYLKLTPCDEMDQQWGTECDEDDTRCQPITESPAKMQYNRRDYLKMEGVSNEIALAYKKNNMYVFLVPTLFFFNYYVWAIILLLEMFFHFWSHLKNGLNQNKRFYFRSPLHVLSSQFCSKCRFESDADFRTFQMLNKQMRQAHLNGTLREVSKALS